MIAIALRFPAGRFHATPWGRHVNEGAPEWPPSPWRLLRALVATWKRKLNDEFVESDMLGLFTKLASPPSFVLPPATTGHSRHYMPWFKKGPDDKTLVFDAFVALNKTADVVAVWPDEILTAEQRDILSRLVEHLGFFGRSESWCDGRLLDESAAESLCDSAKRSNGDGCHWCEPLSEVPVTRDEEVVRVLSADPQTAFLDEHVVRVETVTAGRGKNRQTTITRQAIYEPNWHLCAETKLLHKEKWSDPPGSRWVQYVRRADCFRIAPKRRTANITTPRPQRIITVARYAIDGTVLPLVTETLPLAEKVRFTLMGIFKRLKLREHYGREIPKRPDFMPRSRVFSGKDAHSQPLQGHQHTYYLPTDEDGDGRLDHLTFVAEMGFGADDPLEIKALDLFRRLPFGDGDPLNLLLVGLGKIDDFQSPLLRTSSVWESVTPFIASRHAKKSGTKRDSAELRGSQNERVFTAHILEEELRYLQARRLRAGFDFPTSWRIELLCDDDGVFRIGRGSSHPLGLRPIQFRRFRRKRNDDGGRRPTGAFRIVFNVPFAGPLSLGHSSHFGLGLFVATME